MALAWKIYPTRRAILYSVVVIMMMAVYGWCLYITQDEVLRHATIPSLNDSKGKIYMLYC